MRHYDNNGEASFWEETLQSLYGRDLMVAPFLFPETSSAIPAKKNDPQKGVAKMYGVRVINWATLRGGERGKVSRPVIYY